MWALERLARYGGESALLKFGTPHRKEGTDYSSNERKVSGGRQGQPFTSRRLA